MTETTTKAKVKQESISLDEEIPETQTLETPPTINNDPQILTASRMYETSSSMLLELASNPQFDIATAKELWTMQKEAMALRAKVDYHIGMAKVQSEISSISKRGYNPDTKSNYALLEDIIAAARPIWSKHGFSVSFSDAPPIVEGNVHTTAYVTHISGHVMTHDAECNMDTVGRGGTRNKTDVHGKRSAQTYNQRDLLTLIFAIEAHGADDDGNAAGKTSSEYKKISDEQITILHAAVTDNDLKMSSILTVFNNRYKDFGKLEMIGDIPAEKFDDARKVIEYAAATKKTVK